MQSCTTLIFFVQAPIIILLPTFFNNVHVYIEWTINVSPGMWVLIYVDVCQMWVLYYNEKFYMQSCTTLLFFVQAPLIILLPIFSNNSPGAAWWTGYRYSIYFIKKSVHLQLMKLDIKEIDGVPVTGSPYGSRTE